MDVSLREPVNIKLTQRSYVSALDKGLAFRLYVRASCLTITRPNVSIDYLSWLFSTIVPYSQVNKLLYVSSFFHLSLFCNLSTNVGHTGSLWVCYFQSQYVKNVGRTVLNVWVESFTKSFTFFRISSDKLTKWPRPLSFFF